MPIGPSVGVIRVRKPKIDIKKTAISKIVVSPCNVFYLVNDGSLYGWGSNNKLQFGSGIIQQSFTYPILTFYPNGDFKIMSSRTDTGYMVTYPPNILRSQSGQTNLTTAERNDKYRRYVGYNGSNTYTPDYQFSGNPLDEFSSSNFLKTVRVKVFNDLKLNDIDIVQIKSPSYNSYGTSVLAIDDNKNLYVWGESDKLVFGSFTETNYYSPFMDGSGFIPDNSYDETNISTGIKSDQVSRYYFSNSLSNFRLSDIIDKPKKISEDKWLSVVANNVLDLYKHILLRDDNTIHALGGDTNGIIQLGNKNDWKYISYNYAINNSNELYRLRQTVTTVLTSNGFVFSGYVKSTKALPSVYETKLDVVSSGLKEVILDSGVYETPEDNLNLYLFEDGKLYASGSNYYSGLNDLVNNETLSNKSNILKTSTLISIDNIIGEIVKSAYQNCGTYFAITNSNKLYSWGSDYNGRSASASTFGRGRCRMGRITSSNNYLEIGKVADNVDKIVPTNRSTYVIGTDGSLSGSGYNYLNGSLGDGSTVAGGISALKLILNSGVKDVKSLVTTTYAVGTNGLLSAWGNHADTSSGWLNEDPSAVRYNTVRGIVKAIDGNIYVCDSLNNVIKQIDTSRNLVKNFVTVNNPVGIVQDSSGNFFVTSETNHRIMKIPSDGITATVFAGDSGGGGGNVNATGTTARFNSPRGLTIDSSNNLYVCDSGNNSIKRVTPAGVVSLFSGSTLGTAGSDDTGYRSPTYIKKISGCLTHSLFLREDGKVLATGSNSDGQLGDGTTVNKSTPTEVLSDVKDIAAGEKYSLFLKNDGTVWACGNNVNGQLGFGNTTGSSTIKQITTLTNVVSVFAGKTTSFFLKGDGTVWGCGNNTNGTLGKTTPVTQGISVRLVTTPTDTLVTNIKKISCHIHTIFLTNDNRALVCGLNTSGQLGNGTTGTISQNSSTPTEIATDVIDIFAGENNTHIVKSDGTAYACGNNTWGQIGDNTTTNRLNLVQVQIDNVKFLNNSGNPNLGVVYVKNDNTVFACGNNPNNRFGFSPNVSHVKIPTLIPITDIKEIVFTTNAAIPINTTLFLKNDSTVWFCGSNGIGQAGTGDTVSVTSITRNNYLGGGDISPKFRSPSSIAINPSTNVLYVADTGNHTIRQITTNGTTTTIAGTVGVAGNTTGLATTARLTSPTSICFVTGTIYIKSGTYIRFLRTGNINEFVGGATTGTTDGIGTNGLINSSNKFGSIILNTTNKLLYADADNHSIREIDILNNSISTYSGRSGSSGNVTSYVGVTRSSPIQMKFASNIDRIVVDGGVNSIVGYGITNTQQVYAWGDLTSTLKYFEPTLLTIPPVKDILISVNDVYTTANSVNTIKIASTYFLGTDGGLSAVGDRFLGNGTNTKSDNIIKINLPPVKKISLAGVSKIYALGTNGELSAWGNNGDSLLGNSRINSIDSVNKLTPIKLNFPPIRDIFTTKFGLNDGTSTSSWVTVMLLGENNLLSGWGAGINLGLNNPTARIVIPQQLHTFGTSISTVYPSYFNTVAVYKDRQTPIITYNYNNITKINDDTNWKLVDKHGDFAVKLDNTLWSISSTPFQIGTDNNYENVFYGIPVKSTDALDIRIKLLSSENVDAAEYLIGKNRTTGGIILSTLRLPSPNVFVSEPSKQCFTLTNFGGVFESNRTNITVKF